MGHRIGVGRISSAAVAVGTIGALIVGILVLTEGQPSRMSTQQPAAGIWVVDESTGMLGRADVAGLKVEPVMAIESEHVDLVQSSNTAFVIDRERTQASIVDAASLSRTAVVPLPSHDAQLAFAMVGDQAAADPVMDAAILSPSDGNLWVISVSDFEEFDGGSPPAFSFGAGASMAIGEAGTLFVASPRDGAVYEISHDGAARHGEFEPFAASGGTPVQVSVTPEGWAVLDPRSNRLITDDGAVDLGDGEFALEALLSSTSFGAEPTARPSQDRGSVFLASDHGLVEAAPDAVRTRVRARDDSPARPFRLDDCVYGTWEFDARAVDCGHDSSRVRLTATADDPAWIPASDLHPELRTDGHTVIANDPASGQTWALTPQGAVPLTWDSEPGADSWELTAPALKAAAIDGALPGYRETGQPDRERSPEEEPRGDDHPISDAAVPPASPTPHTRSSLTAGGVEAVADRTAGTITVTWEPFTSEDSAVLGYLVQRLAPGDTSGDCRVEAGKASVVGDDVQSATSTSTLFGGDPPPEGGYRFVVWGYTADDCAAASPIEVQPDPVPAAVTDPHGAMEWSGTRYDYRIAPGDAARYEVQRLDASGSPAGPVTAFAGSALPRELTGGSFGEPLRFTIRACTVWGADATCSPWAEHVAPEPSLDFTLADLAYSEEKSEWTWSALPDNGGKRVAVVCESRSTAQLESGEGYCRALEATSRGDASLTVRVAGVAYRL